MYDDDEPPKVSLPEKLIFVNTLTGEETEVSREEFGRVDYSSNSVTYSADVDGHGTTTIEIFPEHGYHINPPADADVIESESGCAALHQDTIDAISITMPDDLEEDLDEDDY